jgi:hypothetical protein
MQTLTAIRVVYGPGAMSLATAGRYLKKEKALYESGAGHRKQPNLIKPYKKRIALLKEEPPHDQTRPDGTRFRFKPSLYGKLKAEALKLKDTHGFGPHTLCCLARIILREDKVATGDDAFLPHDWTPSHEWGLWFMKHHMNFSLRRVTTEHVTAEATERQSELHKINLDKLAVLLSDGVPLHAIFGVDETGL